MNLSKLKLRVQNVNAQSSEINRPNYPKLKFESLCWKFDWDYSY